MKRSLICFKKFNEIDSKRLDYISFSKIKTKLRLKKYWRTNLKFLKESMNQKS